MKRKALGKGSVAWSLFRYRLPLPSGAPAGDSVEMSRIRRRRPPRQGFDEAALDGLAR